MTFELYCPSSPPLWAEIVLESQLKYYKYYLLLKYNIVIFLKKILNKLKYTKK